MFHSISRFIKPRSTELFITMRHSLFFALIAASLTLGLASPAGAQAQNYVQVSASGEHSCAVTTTGRVQCWGKQSYGRLGNGYTAIAEGLPVVEPTTIGSIFTATAVATGTLHSCALLADRTVRCWGANTFAQSSGSGFAGSASPPATVPGITTAIAITAGDSHSCALLANLTVQCWGAGSKGQIGDNNNTAVNAPTPANISGVTALDAGGETTCAIVAGGVVRCWGEGSAGQLGNSAGADSFLPTNVTGVSGATHISVSDFHACAVLPGGTAACWGNGSSGRLGHGSFASSNFPVVVTGLTNASKITAGAAHTCAVLSSGGMMCWGANNQGQLGDGTRLIRNMAVAVDGLIDAAQASAGGSHTCAASAAGALLCWGDGRWLGNGVPPSADTPVAVLGVTDALEVSAGGETTCIIRSGGTVACWGNNEYGQLGSAGDGTAFSTVPLNVNGVVNAVQISVGGRFVCARLASGAVQCWGGGTGGQLGNGSNSSSATPVNVTGITAAQSIGAGEAHACALIVGGIVQCWGLNASGQLGNPVAGSSNVPVTVTAITTAQSISLSDGHSCAYLSNGQTRCWGENVWGQLGNNTSTNSFVPVLLAGSPFTATAVYAGGRHSCALLSGGAMKCWGANVLGQLGNGAFASSLIPVDVSGAPNATTATLGFTHTCAMQAAGTVSCWGDPTTVGSGGTMPTAVPTPVFGISNATQIDAGRFHTCARLATSRVVCWGQNTHGQLGNGLAAVNRVTPLSLGGSCNMDVDGNGRVDATTDGLMITRALLGIKGPGVTTGALGAQAVRTDWSAVRTYLMRDCGVMGLAP